VDQYSLREVGDWTVRLGKRYSLARGRKAWHVRAQAQRSDLLAMVERKSMIRPNKLGGSVG